MTIKHANKTISGEKNYVITDIEDNPNGILTLTLENQWSGETVNKYIDLTKHKLQFVKLNNIEHLELLKDGTLTNINNAFVGTYIENAFQDLDEVSVYRESKVFLVSHHTNMEGIYREYMWINGDFEIIGSTDIDLEPFFLKTNVYNALDYTDNNNTKSLSAYQGYLLNINKIDKTSIVNNLTTSDTNKVLSATQGKILQDNKVNKTDITDNLTTDDSIKVLSAKQGKALQDNKINKTDIADNLTTDDSTKVLSAVQGKTLQDNKVNKTDIIDNLTSTEATKPLSAKQGKILKDLVDTKMNQTDIIDNLTTNDSNKILSAKQGKILQDTKVNIDDVTNIIEAENENPTSSNGVFTLTSDILTELITPVLFLEVDKTNLAMGETLSATCYIYDDISDKQTIEFIEKVMEEDIATSPNIEDVTVDVINIDSNIIEMNYIPSCPVRLAEYDLVAAIDSLNSNRVPITIDESRYKENLSSGDIGVTIFETGAALNYTIDGYLTLKDGAAILLLDPNGQYIEIKINESSSLWMIAIKAGGTTNATSFSKDKTKLPFAISVGVDVNYYLIQIDDKKYKGNILEFGSDCIFCAMNNGPKQDIEITDLEFISG